MPFWRRSIRTMEGRDVRGTYLLAFIHNMHYYVTDIKIYEDGMIDCWGLVDFEGFKQKVREGWVVTRLPEGARVGLTDLVYLTAANVTGGVPEEEFIKEVADEIEELNGRPTTGQRCLEAWERYQREPSEEARRVLREAYEAVPAHNRVYVLGDMDNKDGPIRVVLYDQ